MPSDNTIEPWNDPAIEARIVALILGEASDYERAELEEAIAADSGLASLHHRISAVHALLATSESKEISKTGTDADWKLSSDRRAKVLETIATTAPISNCQDMALTADGAPDKTSQWRRFAAVAAVFVVICGILGISGFPEGMSTKSQEKAASSRYRASSQHLPESDEAAADTRTRTSKDEPTPTPQDTLATLDAPFAVDRPDRPSSLRRSNKTPSPPRYSGEVHDAWLALKSNISLGIPGDPANGGRRFWRFVPKKKEANQREFSNKNDAKSIDSYAYSESTVGTEFKKERAQGDNIKLLEQRIYEQSNRLKKARIAMLDVMENYNIVEPSLGSPSWARGGESKASEKIRAMVMKARHEAFATEQGIQNLKTTLQALESLSGHEKIQAAVDLELQNWTLIARYPEYQNLLLSRSQLIESGLGIRHSKVVNVDKQIELIQGMLEDAVDTAKDALGTQLEMAKRTLKNPKAANKRSKELSLAERRENVAYLELKENYERQRASLTEMRSLLAKAKAPSSPQLFDLEKLTADAPFSTFSLSVSDVSFKLAKAALLDGGGWPDAAKIRPEEFVNAFDYGDPAPSLDERIACAIEQCVHPFLQQRNLLRISMKTAASGRADGQPLRLTILLDKSGSMERADREASVAKAFEVLASLLGGNDVISVIGFARTPSLIVDRLPGARAGELAALVAAAPSEGGTNLEEALRLAAETATRQFLDGAQNRIVLITDGAANLGDASPESLQQRIIGLRGRGIAFDACGVGADGLNDEILEALARKGDGRYYFLDKPKDADAGFVRQLAGALRPAARNVKVQVKFNPERVTRYRLSGFEKHRLNEEDFRDDAVDAAEIAAAEAGNALYQIEVDPAGQGDIGEVSVRFQDTASGAMVERSWPIRYRPSAPRLNEAAPSMQLAATAGLFGEKLRGGSAGDAVDLATLSTIGTALRNGPFGEIERVRQLVLMIETARKQ